MNGGKGPFTAGRYSLGNPQHAAPPQVGSEPVLLIRRAAANGRSREQPKNVPEPYEFCPGVLSPLTFCRRKHP